MFNRKKRKKSILRKALPGLAAATPVLAYNIYALRKERKDFKAESKKRWDRINRGLDPDGFKQSNAIATFSKRKKTVKPFAEGWLRTSDWDWNRCCKRTFSSCRRKGSLT